MPARRLIRTISQSLSQSLTRPLAGFAAGLLLAMPLLAAADPLYTLTVLAGPNSRAWDINLSGQVVGENAGNAWFHDGSSYLDLGAGSARGINDAGQIAGQGSGGNGFFYSGGVMTAITHFGPTFVGGLNNNGIVVGMAVVEDPEFPFARHAYSWQDGVSTDLGTLYGLQSRAYAINGAGHIVGATDIGGAPNYPLTPFLYRDGVMSEIVSFPGPWSEALAINDHDQVVGAGGIEYDGGGDLYPRTAFLWDAGVLTDIGALSGSSQSHALGINNLSQVIGYFEESFINHAFLYENGSFFDLNDLVDPSGSGWVIAEANGINELGQIAGTACRDGACYAVRLDLVPAVPEPGAWAMLLGGCTLVGWRRRKLAKRG